MPANRVFTTPNDMGRTMLRSVYRPDQWGEHWFGRALPRVRSGGLATVAVYGDSITVGDDASSNFGQAAATNNTAAQKDAWRDYGWVGVMRRGLQDQWGNAGEGYQPAGLAVTTGTWTTRVGPGISEVRATAAASLTWKVKGTTVGIYWRATGLPAGTNQFRYQVDGGGFTTVTQTGASEPGRTQITGLSDAEHTVRVEWVAGTCALLGVRGERAAAGVRVDRFAQHGAAACNFAAGARTSRMMSVTAGSTSSPNITAGTGGYFTPADVGSRIMGDITGALGAYIGTVTGATTATLADANGVAQNASSATTAACLIESRPAFGAASLDGSAGAPQAILGGASGVGYADLVVLALSANDAAVGNRATAQTMRDALGRLATAYFPPDGTASPDFVVVIQHVGSWFNVEGRYPEYAAELRNLAKALDAAVVDAWSAGRRVHQYAEDQRYWSGTASDNPVHLSGRGQGWLGQAMLGLLRQ